VVATGSDETIAEVSRRVPVDARFVGYGHRLSVAALAGEAFDDPASALDLALDISLWDQLGCLSPVAIYCEARDPQPFASALAEALADVGTRVPRRDARGQWRGCRRPR
jgi:hypothetical protein